MSQTQGAGKFAPNSEPKTIEQPACDNRRPEPSNGKGTVRRALSLLASVSPFAVSLWAANPAQAQAITAQAVANLTALKAACVQSSGCPSGDPVLADGVWRLTYGNGNKAEPLWYAPQASACSLNAGNGDNGLQVKSADGNCWIAKFPAGGASVLQFGAIGDGTTDDTTAMQNAINDLPGNGYRIVFPPGNYCTFTGLTIPATPNQGFAPTLVGYSAQSSILNACNHDVTVLTWHGSYGSMTDFAIFGRGVNHTDTFSFSKPAVNIQGGNNYFANLTVLGGTNSILFNGGANGTVVENVFAYNAYGGANVLIQNAGINFIRDQFDQSWPGVADANATAVYGAWAAGTAYATNTVVSLNGYYIQATAGGTSGGSAPALKPYGANIADGTVTWQLLAPVTYYGVQCDTACSETEITDTDIAGPYTYNVRMSNSLSGTAPVGLLLKDVTMSYGLSNAIEGDAGGFLEVKGGSISGCALSGCAGVEVSNQWSGPANVSGLQMTGGFSYGAINAAGSQFNFTDNRVPFVSINGYLAERDVTKFVVANNQFGGGAGVVTIATGAEDYYNIIGNIISGGTVVDNGTGTHKTISGNN